MAKKKSRKNNTGRKRQKTAEKRGASRQFNPEILYQFWASAGGIVVQAMRLAEAAGEDRVPHKPHTWSEYAERHGFEERLKNEERERWEKYHTEREEKQQHVLDGIAHSFEELADAFIKTIMRDVAALHSDDAEAIQTAEKRLSMLFGSIESFDRFYRIYLRSRDLPERLTQQTMKVSPNIVSYEELEEEDEWAKTAEELRSHAKNAQKKN